MQAEASDAFDVSRKEPQHVLRRCTDPAGRRASLLIARRLLERGVRYIQL